MFRAASRRLSLLEGAGERKHAEFREVHVRRFPIRRIHETTPPSKRAQMAEGLRRLYQAYLDEGQPDALLREIERLVPTDGEGHLLAFQPGATGREEHSDVVRDFLAFLAEQMTELHRRRQEEMAGFLAWLERELEMGAAPASPLGQGSGQAGLEALSGKERIKNYLGHYEDNEPSLGFAEFLDLLRKNQRRLGVRLDRRGFQETLKEHYEESLERLLPLRRQLELTDRLIDEVVYRLYGLTGQEIEAVERA